MDAKRLEKIETKLAFQEKAVRELNDVIYAQQREIDRLTAVCRELARSQEQSQPGPANDKPPHY
ncbi:MAG: SlyX family protein [Desulfobacter sp.]|nr:SlyX family protein [Desulfobacter sp.]